MRNIVLALAFVLASFAISTLAQPSCCQSEATCPTQGQCCYVASGLTNCSYLNGQLVGGNNYPTANIDVAYRFILPNATASWADLGPACENYAKEYLCNITALDPANNKGCSSSTTPYPGSLAACHQLFSICNISSITLNFFGFYLNVSESYYCSTGVAPGMQQPLSMVVLAAVMLVTYIASQHQ